MRRSLALSLFSRSLKPIFEINIPMQIILPPRLGFENKQVFLHMYVEEEISHLRLRSDGRAESGGAVVPQPPCATGVRPLA